MFGFGVVGEGLYKVLQLTPSLKAKLKKVCIKNPGKKRNAPASLFTTSKDELLYDPEINVIVEVIDDADAAYHIVSTALQNGKDVVSASKKMIAEHLPALLQPIALLEKPPVTANHSVVTVGRGMKEAIVPLVVFNDLCCGRSIERPCHGDALITFVNLCVTRPAGTSVNVVRWLRGLGNWRCSL